MNAVKELYAKWSTDHEEIAAMKQRELEAAQKIQALESESAEMKKRLEAIEKRLSSQ